MRGMAQVAAFLAIGLSSGHAIGIECPEDTTPEFKVLSEWRDSWCEKDGRKHGPFLSEWLPGGEVRIRGEYREGLRVGVWESFTQEGERTSRSEFLAGQGTDVQTVWYPNGQVRQSARIVDGKPDGSVLRFYEDGTPKEEETFESGTRQGIYRSWYPDGTLFQEGSYEGGSETGTWKTYDRTGELVEALRVERGRVVEVEKSTEERVLPSEAPPSVRMRPVMRYRRVIDPAW